jgi:radical SAM superfamily enzyme YgiQ (UPF0313 family)
MNLRHDDTPGRDPVPPPAPWAAWYDHAWPRLSAGGVWLRGGELNTVPGAEWGRRPYRVLVARLSTYRDTAVSTSHLLIHAVLAGLDGVYPDLAWLPPPRDGELMAADGVPWLLGTQTKRGVLEFDCLGVSLSVPQETINLAAMLLRSGIPVDRRERLDDPSIPLVIAGGASVGAAAALYGANAGVDGIYVGGDPGAIATLFGRCRDGRARGLSKRRVLDLLRDIEGFVLPGEAMATTASSGEAPEAAAVFTVPASAMPVSYDPARTGIVTVPVTEGCRWKCSFCYESWLHPRYRSVPGGDIDQRAGELKAWAGAHRAELFSFNFDMHEDIRGIIDRLSARFDRLGLKSQRFDQLAGDPGLLELMHAVGKTSLTCGMEGISDRLRAYLNKRLDDAKLRRALAAIAAAPLRQVKVFLIATGREREDDFAEFAALLAWFRAELEARGRRPRVIFSITPLVHFPSTPLGFEAPPAPGRTARMVRRIAVAIRRAGFQVRAAARDAESIVSQVLVSGRHPQATDGSPEGAAATGQGAADGDAGVTWRAVVDAVRAHGFVYYDAITPAFRDDFLARLAAADPDEAGPATAPPAAAPGTPVEAVRRVHALSLRGLDLPAGAEAPASRAGGPRQPSPQAPRAREGGGDGAVPAIRRRILAARRDRREVVFNVDLGAPAAGLARGYVAAALGRAFMLADTELIDAYRGPGTSLWGTKGQPCRLVGHDRLGLLWTAAGAARVEVRWREDEGFVAAVNAVLDPWGRVLPAAAPAASRPSLAFAAPFPAAGPAWLAAQHLRYVQRRLPDGPGCRCEIARDSLRKKLVVDYAQRDLPGGGCEVEVVPGERFDPEAFCREAFLPPAPEDQARVSVRARLFATPAGAAAP